MDSLIRKYLDGELTDDESQRLLDRLAGDADLDRGVRALEAVADLGAREESRRPSAGFADAVMADVRQAPRPAAPHAPSRRGLLRPGRLPMAASWLLAVGLGYVLSSGLEGAPDRAEPGSPTPVAAAERGLEVVRLAYAPTRTGVRRVRVAGSFNGWDPEGTPMHRENGHWVATLALPPGTYEYMFLVDDAWVTDPLAPATRDDGFGSRNAVLEL